MWGAAAKVVHIACTMPRMPLLLLKRMACAALPAKLSCCVTAHAQEATGRTVVTGKQNLTTKQLGVLRRKIHLDYPELRGYNFVQRAVCLQLQ